MKKKKKEGIPQKEKVEYIPFNLLLHCSVRTAHTFQSSWNGWLQLVKLMFIILTKVEAIVVYPEKVKVIVMHKNYPVKENPEAIVVYPEKVKVIVMHKPYPVKENP